MVERPCLPVLSLLIFMPIFCLGQLLATEKSTGLNPLRPYHYESLEKTYPEIFDYSNELAFIYAPAFPFELSLGFNNTSVLYLPLEVNLLYLKQIYQDQKKIYTIEITEEQRAIITDFFLKALLTVSYPNGPRGDDGESFYFYYNNRYLGFEEAIKRNDKSLIMDYTNMYGYTWSPDDFTLANDITNSAMAFVYILREEDEQKRKDALAELTQNLDACFLVPEAVRVDFKMRKKSIYGTFDLNDPFAENAEELRLKRKQLDSEYRQLLREYGDYIRSLETSPE